MTRQYALFRLLQLGPLTRRELNEITGWPKRVLDKAITYAMRPRGTIVRIVLAGRSAYRAKTEQELSSRPARKARNGPHKWSCQRWEAYWRKHPAFAGRRREGPADWHEGPVRPREPHPRCN
jgi:hypothetical protein